MTQTSKTKRPRKGSEEAADMVKTVLASLDDAKGVDIETLDVRKLTDVTDFMIITTGTSDRHVKSLSDRVLEFMNEREWKPIGMEGDDARDWVLVDFVDVVVHIMRDKARKHYDLESLWNASVAQPDHEDEADQVIIELPS